MIMAIVSSETPWCHRRVDFYCVFYLVPYLKLSDSVQGSLTVTLLNIGARPQKWDCLLRHLLDFRQILWRFHCALALPREASLTQSVAYIPKQTHFYFGARRYNKNSFTYTSLRIFLLTHIFSGSYLNFFVRSRGLGVAPKRNWVGVGICHPLTKHLPCQQMPR